VSGTFQKLDYNQASEMYTYCVHNHNNYRQLEFVFSNKIILKLG
jgi:hypothetical protein